MTETKKCVRVPQCGFHVRTGSAWSVVTTDEVFAGKAVVVLALPGAFTPTCSSAHLPRYQELAAAFHRAGVDEIVCVSVNDSFVMNAWKLRENVPDIRLLPDGNGAFTEAMGMLVDKSAIGMGRRSRRYSMFVRDRVIERMFIEADVEGDPFEVSGADTMLAYLGGSAPADIVLFTKPGCGHCERARASLTRAGLPWVEVPTSPRMLRALPGSRTTPQVFVGGVHLGGANELETWIGEAVRA